MQVNAVIFTAPARVGVWVRCLKNEMKKELKKYIESFRFP